MNCGTTGTCRYANRSVNWGASAICVIMQSSGVRFCGFASQVTGVAAFPGGATKSFGNDLPKMCGASSFLYAAATCACGCEACKVCCASHQSRC